MEESSRRYRKPPQIPGGALSGYPRFRVRGSRFRVPNWMLDVRCWMLDVGCWMFEVRGSRIDVPPASPIVPWSFGPIVPSAPFCFPNFCFSQSVALAPSPRTTFDLGSWTLDFNPISLSRHLPARDLFRVDSRNSPIDSRFAARVLINTRALAQCQDVKSEICHQPPAIGNWLLAILFPSLPSFP